MFVFFLIIHLILAAIFYFFHDISGRYYESIFFVIAGLLFFYFFSPFYIIGSSEKSSEKQKNFLTFLDKEKLKSIIPNSRRFLYFWAVILFYASIYGIFYGLSLPFDYFIVGISGFFILLFIASRYLFPKEIIYLAFRTNTLIFSAYFFVRMIIMLAQPESLTWIYYVENGIFFLSSVLILLWDTFARQRLKNAIYLFFLAFLFVSFLVYTQLFLVADIHRASALLSILLSVLYFEYIPRIPAFRVYDIVTKYFGLFLNYIALLYIAGLLLLFPEYYWYEMIGLLFLGAAFQYYVHKKFENYISYLFAIGVLVLLYIKVFFQSDFTGFFGYFFFTIILPTVAVAYTFFIKNTHTYDYYILYVCMILFSIGGMSSYFYHFPFTIDSILPVSVFLLFESSLFFVSFVRLKK